VKRSRSDSEDTLRIEDSLSSLYSSFSVSTIPELCLADPSEDARAQVVKVAAAVSAEEEHSNKKKVTFQDVQERHYDLILGDNPHIKYPLSLGWRFTEAPRVPVEDHVQARQDRREQRTQDRIQPRLYVPPEGLGESPDVPDPHYLPLHTEQDFDDELSRKHLHELDLQERRTRLRSFGYSEAHLRREERFRRIALAMDYAHGRSNDDEEDGDEQVLPAGGVVSKKKSSVTSRTSSSALVYPYSPKIFTRYVH